MDLHLALGPRVFALFLAGGDGLQVRHLMDLFVLRSPVRMALDAGLVGRRRAWGGATAVVLGCWAVVSLCLAAIIP